MRAGALRNVGAIEKPSASRDDYGGQSFIWTVVIPRVRFSLEATGGAEVETAGQVRAQSKYAVGMRYFPNIDSGMRLVFGSRVFAIMSVNDPTGLKRELMLAVVEGVSVN